VSRWATLLPEKRSGARLHAERMWSAVEYPRAFSFFGAGSVIGGPVRLRNCDRARGGLRCAIYKRAWMQAESARSWAQLGDCDYLGRRMHFHAGDSIVIGSDRDFPGLTVSGGEHAACNLSDVVWHGDMNNREFVGVGAAIFGGVPITDDAVRGANAAVTKDIPAGAIVAEAPARILRLTSPTASAQ